MSAGTGGYVHLQLQPWENGTAVFTAALQADAAIIQAANPQALISYGLSTNPKYHATAAALCTDWQAAQAILPGAPAWLNILPWPGQQGSPTAVAEATAFLTCAAQDTRPPAAS